ncbi:MAG: hypothetical protein KDE48_06900 [Anaerolineales bacterium]|nr:hypothetical protein [Anaerolineales bacterium]
MTQPISFDKDVLDIIIQVLLVVIPILITWFIRTYVKGSKSERDFAAIVSLSNTAIDYVENLDKRGDLNLPPDVSKGAAKLAMAGAWLEDELKRAGVKMSDEDAQRWIAAEFQKRVGNVTMVSTIARLAKEAIDFILRLEQQGSITLSDADGRIAYLSGLAADWIVAEMAKLGGSISREDALIWARAELAKRIEASISQLALQGDTAVQSVEEQLNQLATLALGFVQDLQTQGTLRVTGEGMETDLATAWLLTEAAKQGLAVDANQILASITNAAAHKR